MKKRLRKKLHKGEFRQLGFCLEFDYSVTDEISFDTFLDSFIDDCIEGNGLECGGGGFEHLSFFVTRYKGSASEEQRNAVKEWLERQPQVSNIILGELIDAWHSRV